MQDIRMHFHQDIQNSNMVFTSSLFCYTLTLITLDGRTWFILSKFNEQLLSLLWKWWYKYNTYLKTIQTFQHSDPLKSSPGSHSQYVSCSVGITSNWCFHSRLASHLCCLCSLVSQTHYYS